MPKEVRCVKKKCRILLNLFTAIMPFAAWLSMLGGASGVLSSHGLASLKYFTVLSNLFEGIASLAWLLTVLKYSRAENSRAMHSADSGCTENRPAMHRAEAVKFTASLCVLLTFTVVMVFLGPLFGYPSMFKGANFWLHLVVPLAALAEMVFLVRENITLRETACSVLPVVVYGCFYLGNILLHGVRDENGWNDFYGFVTWGLPAGLGIFALICLFVFLAGLVMRRIIREKTT